MARLDFVLSAPAVAQLPPDDGAEVALIGRSNVGKSSLLNRLGQHKKLARTSKTPGCTLLLNAYVAAGGWRLIDLPGYGFAKRSQAVTDVLGKRIQSYFSKRESLRLTVVIVDIRRQLDPKDITCLTWLYEQGRHVHLVLNKADKLSRNQGQQAEHAVRRQLDGLGMSDFGLLQASATSGAGCEALWQVLDDAAQP